VQPDANPSNLAMPGRLPSSTKYVMTLLFLGNLLNFFDRQIPAVLLGEIQETFGIGDTEAAATVSAFVVVAALAAVPLGRLSDRYPRKAVAGWALIIWSLFTALGGVFGGLVPLSAVGATAAFWVFFVSRLGVGIGEAGYAPSAGSLMADLYPLERRSRANATFMLGFPVGTVLAFVVAGPLAEALGNWHAVFLIAAVPGIVVGLLMLGVREPERGAIDGVGSGRAPARATVASVLRVRSMRGLVVAFAGYTFGSYALGTFLTVALQRSFNLGLADASKLGGVVVGLSGLVGLLVGGRALDRAARRSAAHRVRLAAIVMFAAAVACAVGLASSNLVVFVLALSVGYMLGMMYTAFTLPAVADVVGPHQRATAIGVQFAVGLLLGGAGGPVAVGVLSDTFGDLQYALLLTVPVAYAVAALGLFAAARTFGSDRARMLETPADFATSPGMSRA
jgi:MFS transporter, Spinster family, sphingosine-1-phosphate transporter